MVDDLFDADREFNRELVRKQRATYAKPEVKRGKVGPVGIARVVLFMGQYVCPEHGREFKTIGFVEDGRPYAERYAEWASARGYNPQGEPLCECKPSDDQMVDEVKRVKKELRKDAQSKGFIVTSVKAVRLLNGDVEVRGELSKREAEH
jgi:hypothetical protein